MSDDQQSPEQFSSDQFLALLDAAVEDTLLPEQVQQLESILRDDESARQEYQDYMQMHLELHFAARAGQAAAKSQALSEPTSTGTALPIEKPENGWVGFALRRSTLTFLAIAASLLCIASVLWPFSLFTNDPHSSTIVGESVAVLVSAEGVQWTDRGSAPSAGESLAAGRCLSVAKGIAKIEMSDGAKVSLEGPASLQLNTPMDIMLLKGNLTAEVPPQAIGFRVDTPSSRVVDLGTEFGVKVTEDGSDEIYVFKGRVDAFLHRNLERGYDKQVQLFAGQAAKFNMDHASVLLRGANSSIDDQSPQPDFRKMEFDAGSHPRYVLSQSYLRSKMPGTYSVEGDVLSLRAGVQNTVCVMRGDSEYRLEVGERLEVNAPTMHGKYDGEFLMCSTVTEQSDGVSSFGLRLRRDRRGIWLTSVVSPDWRRVVDIAEARKAMQILPDPGGPLSLSIERVSNTKFRAYYQKPGSDNPVLVGEADLPALASHESLYVGVQAFCQDASRTYSFSGLKIVPLESVTTVPALGRDE